MYNRSLRIKPLLCAALIHLLLAGQSPLSAQEALTPEIKGVVAANTRIEFIQDGFQGTEGPVPLADGSLIFTEWQGSRIIQVDAKGATSTWLDLGAGHGVNSLAWNRRGELLAIGVGQPGIHVIYPRDHLRAVTTEYNGIAYGRLNDLVISKQDGLYFTDMGATPPSGDAPASAPPAAAVYYVSPKGQLQQVSTQIARPNGIALSPDDKTLYVANTWGDSIVAFDIQRDGSLTRQRDFAKLQGFAANAAGIMTSGADGLAVDAKGRLYVATSIGVQVFDRDGVALGVITLPKPPNNLAFAGNNNNLLYIVGRGGVWRIATQTQGVAGRAK